jgi:hypothetical protein
MAESVANQNPTPSQVLGRANECLRRLLEAGLPFDALQKPIDDPKMRERLVGFWVDEAFMSESPEEQISRQLEMFARATRKRPGYSAEKALETAKEFLVQHSEWLRASEIMGRNMFGIEEAIQHFGVNPTKREVAVLSEIPFSEETLEACKDSHVLIAVFQMSILDIRSKGKLFYNQDCYNEESSAKEKGETEWKLVRKTWVANSTSKTWPEQQALLANNEEMPTARTMVYTIIGHFLATGERLFENVYVRSSDVDSDGRRVRVGFFDSDGLNVNVYWDGIRRGRLGVSSARKSE